MTATKTRTATPRKSAATKTERVEQRKADVVTITTRDARDLDADSLVGVTTIGKALQVKGRSAEARKIRAQMRKAGKGVGRGNRYPVALLEGDTAESIAADLRAGKLLGASIVVETEA